MRSEDGHIIHECLNGDSASFGLLVDKYKAGIYALAYSRLHNLHDAEDIAQEVFLNAYKNLRNLRRWDSFLVWLRSMTINLCKNKLRAQSRQPDREFIQDQKLGDMEEISSDPLNDEEELAHREKMLDSLDKGLQSLPEIYQQVLTLHYLGGMSGEQISHLLGVSHDTVRQRLSRARNLLKEEVLAMMGATYEQQKLQASFTFRIVEAIKRIKIQPVSNTKGIPIGLSIATGIILTILSINPHFTIPEYVGTPLNSPLPSETKVLKTGEIPVDVVKIFKTPIISSQQDKGKGGEKLPDPQNTIFLAPQGEGNTWTKKADMPMARETAITALNGKIYAIGGWVGIQASIKSVDEYDPVKDKWETKSDMQERRCYHSASSVNGKIYVFGGLSGNGQGWQFLSSVEEYDPVKDLWTKKKDMPSILNSYASCALGSKIYVMGGWNWSGDTNVLYEYDTIEDSWTEKAKMPTARQGLSACAVNGKIYAIGGVLWPGDNITKAFSTVEEYDPVTDTWIKKADMPTPRGFFATSVVGSKIYVVGGGQNGPPNIGMTKVEIYDPLTDTWAEGINTLSPRWCVKADAIDNKIYAIGGSSGRLNPLSTVEEFDTGFISKSIDPNGKLPTTWGETRTVR